MPAARVLVVEDDRTTADLIALYLCHAGYHVSVEHDGSRALERVGRERFDLLVLDVMVPGVDGLEICRTVRASAMGTAVIMVTARTREDQRVEGLDLGADDYVTKPFSPRELVARAGAVLRRRPPGDDDVVRRGAVVLDRSRREVTVAGRPVRLTPTEFALLDALARRPGHVRTRGQLLDALPGEHPDTLERTVDVHIRNLRRKMEPDPDRPRYVETVVGYGYRFAPDVAR